MKRFASTMAVLGAVAAAPAAYGAIVINEFAPNPPGADNGIEWFELLSTTGGAESLNDLSVINIEGDVGGGLGLADKVVSLAGLSTGSNGLFLWRDAATVINPAPDPATTVHVADFSPDWENPSGTFLLVSGFTGAQGDDLDTDDDGVLDVLPWAAVLDGFGATDGGADDRIYASQFGFADYPGAAATQPGALDMFVRGPDGSQHRAGVSGNPTDGYTVDDSETLPMGYQITPGNLNPVVPEPASLAMLAMSAGALLVRRRK